MAEAILRQCSNCNYYKKLRMIDTYQKIKYPHGAGMCERICFDKRNGKLYSPVGGKNGLTLSLRVDAEFYCKFYEQKKEP